MNQRPRTERSDLADAAAALEAELRLFEKTAAEVRGQRLDSAKNLERAVKSLQRLAELERRLETRLGELVGAIRAADARQKEATATIAVFGTELQARQTSYVRLAEAFDAFGREVGTVASVLGGGPERLGEAQGRVEALEERARQLADEADQEGFQDLAADARARQKELKGLVAALTQARSRIAES